MYLYGCMWFCVGQGYHEGGVVSYGNAFSLEGKYSMYRLPSFWNKTLQS